MEESTEVDSPVAQIFAYDTLAFTAALSRAVGKLLVAIIGPGVRWDIIMTDKEDE